LVFFLGGTAILAGYLVWLLAMVMIEAGVPVLLWVGILGVVLQGISPGTDNGSNWG